MDPHETNLGCEDVDISEQYRIMAQMEANLRVKDNTGFDMDEYREQSLRLEKEREQEEAMLDKCHSIPQPKLPDKNLVSNAIRHSSSVGQNLAEEPPLPFTRANRRYVQSGKSSSNSRETVPELCQGAVVPKPLQLDATEASMTTRCCKEHVLQCWGCSVYLSVKSLATLVQCPECLTISPVT